ncbi:RNA-guided endonuclease InsQ/TnpB family protein [Henriciella aquimarina]|uniref:RNA-guided endonuclease InsQ/TnpB family protein n=1 Tax=Henriciella aquimarina TaxID=545261 RepID=UPI0009FE9827|nr:RNA-guided endonuclease TnpB family protein [Henriciella aquimarina]
MKQTKTLRVRVKDNHSAQLRRMARSVNLVWNYVNELSERSIRERDVFLSAFDLQKYVQGVNQELGLHSHTPVQVCKEYATRRKQFKRRRLAWRKSYGARRSLGWVPINTGMAQWKNGGVYHNGTVFKVWDSWGLADYKFRSSSFSEDARGLWYFNVVVEFEARPSEGAASVGIDLGCKDAATVSDGTKETGRWYRGIETDLATAQRARKKKRVAAIHAKAANRRKDAMHKLSRKLVDANAAIFVGNVSSKAMSQTRNAKSALDAGWGMLKTMLSYKCDHAGIVFEEVNEAFTTQRCSCCGVIPDSSPKGMGALGIREWECGSCGAVHDRDVNAARNILALGHERLAGGMPVL